MLLLRGGAQPPRVTFRRVAVPLRGPEQSPGLPFACCVGSVPSGGHCGLCSLWCRFRIRGAQQLAYWGLCWLLQGSLYGFCCPAPPPRRPSGAELLKGALAGGGGGVAFVGVGCLSHCSLLQRSAVASTPAEGLRIQDGEGWRVLPPQVMRKLEHGAGGWRNTKCCASARRGTARHFRPWCCERRHRVSGGLEGGGGGGGRALSCGDPTPPHNPPRAGARAVQNWDHSL